MQLNTQLYPDWYIYTQILGGREALTARAMSSRRAVDRGKSRSKRQTYQKVANRINDLRCALGGWAHCPRASMRNKDDERATGPRASYAVNTTWCTESIYSELSSFDLFGIWRRTSPRRNCRQPNNRCTTHKTSTFFFCTADTPPNNPRQCQSTRVGCHLSSHRVKSSCSHKSEPSLLPLANSL